MYIDVNFGAVHEACLVESIERSCSTFPKWKVGPSDLCKMKFNMINFINMPFSLSAHSIAFDSNETRVFRATSH